MTASDLFLKPVMIAIKSSLLQPQDNQLTTLILISINYSKTTTNSNCLNIQLTDDADPFFLYQLQLSDEDFHVLKQEQQINVDFFQFPSKFIELLEFCIQSSKMDHPKFICELVKDQNSRFATFSIIETNSFKHINHLSLKLVPGTDTTIKQYLAQVVNDLKCQNLKQSESISNYTKQVSSMSNSIDELSNKLQSLKATQLEEISELSLKHAKELAYEKEKHFGEKDTVRESSDKELKLTKQKYESEISSLNEKLTAMTTSHSHILQHAQTLEKSLQQANTKYELLNVNMNEKFHENENLSKSVKMMEERNQELQSKLANLEKSYVLSKEKEKEAVELCKQATEKVDLLNSHLKLEDESTGMLKTQIYKLEEGIQRASDEITKGNEIIKKLQADLKNSKSKLKLKNIVTLQQEKLLDERAATIDGLQKDLNEYKSKLEKKALDYEEQVKTVESLTESLTESKKIIKDNNHVIEWLHKQLNEEALNRPLSMNPSRLNTTDFSKYNLPERHSPIQRTQLVGAHEMTQTTPLQKSPTFKSRPPSTMNRVPTAYGSHTGTYPTRGASPIHSGVYGQPNIPNNRAHESIKPTVLKSNYF